MSNVEIQHRTGASRSPRSRSIVFGVVLAFSLLVMTVPFAWRILAGRKSTTAVSPPPLDAAPTVEAPAAPPPRLPTPAHSPLADALLAPGGGAARDVALLRGLLGQFTTTFRLEHRPPLGDNADITAALTGANRQQLTFVPADHTAIRADGGVRQLVDRWGTPFFFHARSAEDFDVRSAGPDRRLFTADDVVSQP